MAEVISNTSPLLYLYRVQAIGLLPTMFGGAWTPAAVVQELRAGREKGHAVPSPVRLRVLALADESE